ncbi:MAG: hypothetical protein R6T96_13690 [Longimicrobiales bacterium]
MQEIAKIAVTRMDADGSPRIHLLKGEAGEPGNWNLTLTPEPEGDPLGQVLSLLRDGWKDFLQPRAMPAWDGTSGVIHVGIALNRDGFLAEIARTFRPGESPDGLRKSEIVEDVLQDIRQVARHHGDQG